MTFEEFEALSPRKNVKPLIGALDETTKTLLYGYTSNRETWQVFQHEGLLHRIIYDGLEGTVVAYEHADTFEASALVPNKRLYPEGCDREFCSQMLELGLSLPFTNYGLMAKREIGENGLIAGTPVELSQGSPKLG